MSIPMNESGLLRLLRHSCSHTSMLRRHGSLNNPSPHLIGCRMGLQHIDDRLVLSPSTRPSNSQSCLACVCSSLFSLSLADDHSQDYLTITADTVCYLRPISRASIFVCSLHDLPPHLVSRTHEATSYCSVYSVRAYGSGSLLHLLVTYHVLYTVF